VTSIRDAGGEAVARPGRLDLPVEDAGAIGALLFAERGRPQRALRAAPQRRRPLSIAGPQGLATDPKG
jgi:hypothetical protein